MNEEKAAKDRRAEERTFDAVIILRFKKHFQVQQPMSVDRHTVILIRIHMSDGINKRIF